MKRLAAVAFAVAFGFSMVSASAFAGIDYVGYRNNFMEQKQPQNNSEESKHFEHKTEAQRGTDAAQMEAKPQQDPYLWHKKYERSYSDPFAK